ncbi:MAG: DUF4956 domain-containing protein [Lachnospiraceae bacterium]|nr:DUF4956 domain-containing protein [Lachnospiraceae bacterium]
MLNSILTTPITFTGLFLTLSASLIMGILSSLIFSFRSPMSSSLSLTLVILPVAMSMVVMMVNGNLGIAVAVAGGFTLVRFRSIAGTGREISAVFSVMTLGVICGMGYMGIAFLFLLFVAAAVLLLTLLHFGENHDKLLKVTFPENYDYTGLLDDVFQKYQIRSSIDKVKTTNMGSLVDVTYRITLPGETLPKEALDEIRSRNANLGVQVASYESMRDSL